MSSLAVDGRRLPLRPIPDDAGDTIERCLAQVDTAVAVADECARRNITDVFLVGVGGSLFTHYPLWQLLQSRLPSLAAHLMTANEFNLTPPARLGSKSLVVVASHAGTTPESVEAARTARKHDAYVVTISSTRETPLGEPANSQFTYESNDTVVDAKHVLLHQLGVELLARLGTDHDRPAMRAALETMPRVLVSAKQQAAGLSTRIAERFSQEPITYVLGSGSCYGLAQSLAMCYLQEMQWMHAAAVNSGDFLHGPFEVVQDDTAIVVLLDETPTRAMDERAKNFAERYSHKVETIDTRSLSFPGVVPDQRPFVSPLVMGSVITRIIVFYEHVRSHSKDDRRYMWRVEY